MLQIGFAGIGETPRRELEERVKIIIRSLKECCPRAIILTGGYWGIMKTIIDESSALGLITVVFPPIEREECPEGSICIRSGLSYKNRSIPLVRSSNILIVVGGGAGTILELIAAYAMGIPVLVLTNTNLPSDKIESCFGEYIDHRRTIRIHYYTRPEKLAQDICKLCKRGNMV